MPRTALLCALLAACASPEAPSPLGARLAGTCTTLDDALGLTVQAQSQDTSILFWLEHTAPDMSGQGQGNVDYELANLADEPSELHIYTGVDHPPACADSAAELSWQADYRAIGGTLYLDYLVGELEGTLEGGVVDLSITHLVLWDGDDDPLYYGDLALGGVEVEGL